MGAGARLDHRERAGSKHLPSSVQKKISISLVITFAIPAYFLFLYFLGAIVTWRSSRKPVKA